MEQGGKESKLIEGKLKLGRIALEKRRRGTKSMSSAMEWLKRKRGMEKRKEKNEEKENYRAKKRKK